MDGVGRNGIMVNIPTSTTLTTLPVALPCDLGRQIDTAVFENVPADRINECLCLYPETHRHLRDIRYHEGELQAALVPHQIDYSNITVDYYTASQITLIASQMVYVLAGCLFFDPAFPKAAPDLYPEYLHHLKAGELYYTKFNLRLRKKTSNSVYHSIRMTTRRVAKRHDLYIMASALHFPNQNASAEITTVMTTARCNQ